MEKYAKNIILFLLLILLVSGCSTNKNTWLSRNYQALNTRFNVYFNGDVSYNDGLKNIQRAHKEDYSGIIPMYPISVHSNANSAQSNMDLAIEKCRKAIKLHSIKVKPQKNYKKSNSPEYKLFYNQEEFNPAMKDVWLLQGKAEFHKADFLGSVGTFSYIKRHFESDKSLEVTCQLWIARAYGEMGWIYEAEQVLSSIQQNNLKHSNVGLFASVNADILLKKHLYKEAIPFVQLALSKETDKYYQQRFSYLLAQLYKKINDKKAAYDSYSRVIKLNAPYEMEFNARVNRAQLDQGNIADVRKELLNLMKNRNNKNYLDLLYYALGNTYLQHADTLKAIENYKLSAVKSTQKGLAKAATLITLGDIYYSKRKYVLAQPCYEEAGRIITKDHEDYNRVSRLGEMLSELVVQNNIVVLQDSLQRLSAMSEDKRLEVVNTIINKFTTDERAAAQKEAKEKQEAIAEAESESESMGQPIGMNNLNRLNKKAIGGSTGEWYFYNPNTIKSGEAEFLKRWGNRKLEDNWRRINKSTSLIVEDNPAKTEATKDVKNDTTPNSKGISDNKRPEFYLKQIPVSAAQIEKSNADIATALFTMGQIYKDKIEDIPMSIATFEEFCRRFGSDKRVADGYFNIYLMQLKNGNQDQANLYRTKLIADFPSTNYKKILSQPDYAARLESMYKEQDSIYNLTYKAFNQSDYKIVYKLVAYVKQNFPQSTLMPKFLFLNALSIGKNDKEENFRTALTDLLKNYPESDVSAMAKDILALMRQGQEAKQGTSGGSLLTRREEKSVRVEDNKESNQQFTPEKDGRHRVLFISQAKAGVINKILYNIASFNFSRFMIKDFDLVVSKLDSTRNVLAVTNFESYDETVWYLNSVSTDASLTNLLDQYNVQKVIISDRNFALVKTTVNLDDYLLFHAKKLENKPGNPVVLNTPPVIVEKVIAKDNTTKQVEKKVEITVSKTVQKLEEKRETKLSEKPVENLSVAKAADKPIEKPVQPKVSAAKPQAISKSDVTTQKPEVIEKETQVATPAKPKQETAVPLFKGLFAYRANEPHLVAVVIVSGSIDFAKTKSAFDEYNAKNYGIMNLKVTLENKNNQQMILVGPLNDAQVAKSYLLRMVKEKTLFEGLKAANYRNIVATQENLNTIVQKNQLKTYFEFMQEYYLK